MRLLALIVLVGTSNGARVEVDVRECLPVGYGLSCGVDVKGSGPAALEVCAGGGSGMPQGLYERGSRAPIIGHPGPPLPMWLTITPASASDRYCDILIQGTTHSRVTAFGSR